jgi:pseudaminic acid cytidylyltransferase
VSRLAILPARGGSSRIPRKNISPFMGRPMIEWPLQAARESALFDHIIVSTDDDVIEQLATRAKAWAIRRNSDNGDMGTQEVASRVIDYFPHCEEVCVIYPCSPMLRASDLRSSHTVWRKYGRPFARSVLPDGSDAGCFYWGTGNAYRERRPLDTTPKVNIRVPAARFIDINTPEDWSKAESMFKALQS